MSNRKHRKSIKPATARKADATALRIYRRDQAALRIFGGKCSYLYHAINRRR